MIENYQKLTETLIDNKVFAVIRLSSDIKALKVIEAVIEGGIFNIEVTLTTPNALKLLREASKSFSGAAVFGVGSVLDENMAEASISNGAEFVVTPIFNSSIIDYCHENDRPCFAGAYSPTEIINATNSGADIVKVFPANIVGLDFFKAVIAPMPKLKIMPTGGVTLNNAVEWLSAGACAIGIGSALLNIDDINENNFNRIRENAKLVMKNIQNYIKSK